LVDEISKMQLCPSYIWVWYCLKVKGIIIFI